jgi:hypothetical protein
MSRIKPIRRIVRQMFPTKVHVGNGSAVWRRPHEEGQRGLAETA